MKAIIIQGSSRSSGNTRTISDELVNRTNCDLIVLKNHNISYYDYESKNREDDFIPLMKKVINNYDTIIFASPVYWYSMSGILKVFFDRMTDLVTIEKELDRKMKGKNTAVLSTSAGKTLDAYFYIPFKETARYLGMNYIGDLHSEYGNIDEANLNKFIGKLNANSL